MEYLRTLKPMFAVALHWKTTRFVLNRCCSNIANISVASKEKTPAEFKSRVSSGPSFQDFIRGVSASKAPADADGEHDDKHAYLPEDLDSGDSRKGWSAPIPWKRLPSLVEFFCMIYSSHSSLF